eukprot:6358391-Prymnesium_polylepis.1
MAQPTCGLRRCRARDGLPRLHSDALFRVEVKDDVSYLVVVEAVVLFQALAVLTREHAPPAAGQGAVTH